MAEAVQQVAAGNAPALPEQAKETEQIAASSTPSPDVRRALARARAYQRELFEEACKQNIVAFLDTGSGKTLISILLIRHKMDELKHNVGPNKKLAIFLAPEVALVVQQAEVIRFHTNFSVGHYYGEKGVDFWKLHEWQKQFAQNDVLVMTHQILSNMLKSGFITMERIHLLIFDECHHVKKGHAGNVIMQEFYHNPRYQGSRPHIFGMTASPLDQKSQGKDKTAQFFDELERNLNAKVMTVADRSELDRIVHKPIESIIKYPGTVTNAATGEVLVQLEVICQNLTATSQLKQMELQEADVQRAGLVSAGVTFDREKRSTASGIMARNLRGVAHILKTLGPFCAGMCLKEILTPPTKRGRISDERHKSAEAHPKFGAFLDSDSEDELDDIRDDTWWVGAARAKPVAPSNSSEGTALTEAFSEATQLLCHLLLSHLPSKAQIAADIRADKSTWADARQHLVAALACTLDQIPTSRLDLEIDAVMSAMERGVSSAHASAMAPLVSAKAAVLVRHLQQYQEAASAKPAQPGSLKWSAIVFAKRKLTVVALNRLISQVPKLAFLKPMAIMGHGGLPALSLSVKKQQEVLELVRKGAVNLLVSTAVAEEGLDLVQCAVVVRYDLPDRPVDYIQSRGRARAPNSRMVLMVERDNPLEHQLIDDVRRCEEQMRAEALRRRDLTLPHLGLDFDSDDEADALNELSQAGQSGMEYHVPSTGACVTLSNAKSLLFYFCNKLPSDRYASGAMRPRFSTTILQGPDGLPVEPEPLSGQQQPLVSAPSQPIPPTAAHASQLAAAAGQPTNGHAAGQPADCAADAILQQQQQQQSGGAEPQSILSSPVTGVPAAPDAMEAADASVSLSGKAEPSRQPSSATVIMSPAAVNQSAQVKKHPSGAIVLSTAASEDELREREGNPRRHRKSRRLARHEAAAAAAAAADGEAEEDEDEGSKQSNCWFQAQVLLPNNCPVPRAQGPPQPKRSLAVAAACVEAIRQLHQAGAMSDYLIPDSETLPEPDKDTADDYTSVDQLPELSANPGASDLPRLASIAPKVPDILKQPPAAVESGLSQGFLRVHIYRFSLHVPRPHPDDHKELSQPLGLVVPRKLPSLPGGMPVTLASGSKALASLVYLGFHSVSPDRMAQIRRFHNAMCDVAASKPKASSTSAQAQTITATPLAKRRRTGPNPIAAPPPPATAKLAELPAVPVEMEDGELPIQPTSAAATQPEVVQACRRRLAAEVQQGAVQQSSEAKTTDAAAQTAQGLAPTSVPADKSMAEAFQSAAAAAEQSDLQLKAAAPGSQHDQISDNRLQPAPDATVMPALDAAEQLVSNPGPHANGHISPPFSSAGVQPATAAQPVASKQVIEWHPDTQPASPVSAGNQRMARKQHASAAIQHFIGFLSSPVKPKTNGPMLSLLKMQLAGIKPTKLPKTQAMPAHAGAKLPTRRNSSAIRSPGGPTLVEDVPTASMPAALHVTASALSPLGIGQLRMPTQQMTSAAPTTSSQLSAACNGQATATNMKLQLSAVPDNAHKTVAASPDTATASKRGQLPIKRNAAEDPAGVKQLSSSVLVCPQIQSGASMTEPPAKRVCTDSAQQPAQDVQMQDSLPAAKHSAPGTPAQPDLEPAVVQPIVLKPADSVTVTTATAKSAPIDSAPGFQAAAAKPHANPASDPAMPSGSAAPAASVRDDSAEPAWGLAVVPLLPASSHSTQHFTPKALADQIDWKGLDKMSRERMTIPWDSMGRWALEDFLEDAMLVTTYNGMLYAFRGMEYGMNPSMVMPCSSNGPVQSEHTSKDASADVVGSKHRQPELGGQMTFITYYRYRWKVGGVKPEQPLIKVVSKDGRFTSDTEEEKLIYLVPQLCHVHPLRSAAVGAAKRLLPRLLWQLHVLLLAEELRGFMASFMYEVLPAGASFRQPELKKVVEAVTPQASQEEYSYEVLENLGDAFVKYSTCLSLFTSFPSAHEGQLTARKDRLVSNENLARVGLRLGLEHYIALPWQSYSFRNGCVAAPPRQMRIKVVADCVEALTGVFFLAGGEQAGFAFVAGALELLPMLTPLAPAAVRSDISSKSVRALEEVVGYRWRNAGLAREACTHCSWPDSACPSYQRLEFLGDALIDLGVTHHFATTHRNITPGRMHDLRSASVNNTRMSCAAAARRLHTFLRYMSAQLFGDIERFMTGLHNSVQAKKEAMLKANHAQLRCMPVVDGQRRKDRLTLDAKRRVYDETVQEAGFGHSGIAGAPKVLGDIVEALAAAVYLDSGRDLDLTWRIFGDMLSPLPTPDTVPMHPVRDILERCNKAGFIFKFETVLASDEGCTAQAAVVDDVVLGKCTSAPNMKAARLLCAKDAIQNWIKAPAPKPGSVTAAILEGQSSRPHN